ncbi:MAG: diaminopimelate decarboxylase [Gammaproteobacteria bacterium]
MMNDSGNNEASGFFPGNFIQGVSLLDIAREYGTPLYLYDYAKLHSSWQELRSVLPLDVDIFYSLKANPNPTLVKEFCALDAGAEVCSLQELETALQTGFSSEDILFLGPGKTHQEIEHCLDVDIYALVCESFHELNVINKLAQKRQKKARVAIRINPNFCAIGAALKMGGRPTQFGIDENELLAREKEIFALSFVDVIGIHIYNGTRILDHQSIVENSKRVLNLADSLERRWGKKWEMVDVGGGIGVPYFPGEKTIEIESLRVGLSVLSNYKKDHPKTRIIWESGRFLVASCGYLLMRILDIKKSKGENFIITNGGMNCFSAATGAGSVLARNFPISLIKKDNDTAVSADAAVYTITGRLCTPGDVIARKVFLNSPKIGDQIALGMAGAYGRSASPGLFLSHGYPMEILIKNGEMFLI